MDIGISSRKAVSVNTKVIFGPFLTIIVILVLFVFLLRIGYNNVNSLIGDYNTAKETESILVDKLEVLQEIKDVLADTEDISLVMPQDDPALLMISQLKTVAAQNTIILTDFSFKAPPVKQDLLKTDISLTGDSVDIPSLVTFFKTLDKVAPISTLDTVQIDIVAGSVIAGITISVYSAPLPTTLPPLIAPIKELSQEEKEMLVAISNFVLPATESLSPSGPYSREDPFN